MLKRGKKPTRRVGEKNPRKKKKTVTIKRGHKPEKRTQNELTVLYVCVCVDVVHHRSTLLYFALRFVRRSRCYVLDRLLPLYSLHVLRRRYRHSHQKICRRSPSLLAHAVAPVRAPHAFARTSSSRLYTKNSRHKTHQTTIKCTKLII